MTHPIRHFAKLLDVMWNKNWSDWNGRPASMRDEDGEAFSAMQSVLSAWHTKMSLYYVGWLTILNHVGTQRLETSRLVLRRHELTDADDMFRNWVTDPEVCRFWQWKPHISVDETRCLLKGWIEEYRKPDNYHWIIVLKEISQAIGYLYWQSY